MFKYNPFSGKLDYFEKSSPESDTLQSVTDRGNTTTNDIGVNGIQLDTTPTVTPSAPGLIQYIPGFGYEFTGDINATDYAVLAKTLEKTSNPEFGYDPVTGQLVDVYDPNFSKTIDYFPDGSLNFVVTYLSDKYITKYFNWNPDGTLYNISTTVTPY